MPAILEDQDWAIWLGENDPPLDGNGDNGGRWQVLRHVKRSGVALVPRFA
jgi:hypothetical protein